jgi:hypothetical protein
MSCLKSWCTQVFPLHFFCILWFCLFQLPCVGLLLCTLGSVLCGFTFSSVIPQVVCLDLFADCCPRHCFVGCCVPVVCWYGFLIVVDISVGCSYWLVVILPSGWLWLLPHWWSCWQCYTFCFRYVWNEWIERTTVTLETERAKWPNPGCLWWWWWNDLLVCHFICLACARHSITTTTIQQSLAQQPTLSQGLPQKLLPSVPISCRTPPMSFPQLLRITRHSIFPS